MRKATHRIPIISSLSLAFAIASALTALTFGMTATAANAELSSKKVAYVSTKPSSQNARRNAA
jgi:hypothetical protein